MATNSSVPMWKSKQLITAFILGIVVAIFIGHAYIIYQTRALALENRAYILELDTFLVNATGGAPATGAPIDNGSVSTGGNSGVE